MDMVSGVIHIGANHGQEAVGYYSRGCAVLWIEAHPEIFPELEQHIKEFENQKAIQALVVDRDGVEYRFHCGGQSSSIFDFNLHKKKFPKVKMTKTISIQGESLPTILAKNKIDIKNYETLVMDVEGAELLVLKGAVAILSNFKTIILEACDFESRYGQPLLSEIDDFMSKNHFIKSHQRKIFDPDGENVFKIDEGDYYEVCYEYGGHPL
jgi:FkbM family methyltransferase